MIRARLAFALAAFAACLGTALADELPSADDILERSRVATGAERKPDTEREVWVSRAGGLQGSLEMLRRGADTLVTTELGPFHTERGTWRGQRWHQNENGETILERSEPSQAERSLSQTVARVREPVDSWEIATTYASGHVERAYYDARTSYLVRTERVAAGHTTHTVFDDFRIDARGRVRPWHYFGGDDRAANDFDYRLERDDLLPEIGEAELSVPHDRRALVEFPAGVDTLRLPARIENGRIYVRLQIGGRGLDFLLDTGAAWLTLDEGVARQLGLPSYGRTARTAGGNFETSRVVVPAVGIGALSMHDVVMHTAPLALQESRATRVVGLLGFDFLDAVALKIDYAGGAVEALRAGSLAAPVTASSLDVRLNSGAPVARATLGDASGDDFILDTGAAFSYVVFQRFARAHPEAVAPAAGGRLQYGYGVGGALSFRPVAAKKLSLGGTVFEGALGVEALSPNALGFDNEDGLIGASILKQFTVYLDYGAGRVYLGAPPPLPPRQETALSSASGRR